MFGAVEPELIAAIAGAIVTVATGLAVAAVKIISALKGIREDNESKKVELKVAASDAHDDLKGEVLKITDAVDSLGRKVDSRIANIERKLDIHGRNINQLGKDQSVLLGMVADLDTKVSHSTTHVHVGV